MIDREHELPITRQAEALTSAAAASTTCRGRCPEADLAIMRQLDQHSIDDTAAKYVPELEATAYGSTPLRALLHMSSGVAFRETYQEDDDVTKFAYRAA